MTNHLQLPVVITPTRAEAGARCHRRHFLGDILNRARYYSASLEFGSLVHAGVAAHWLGRDWHSALAHEWQTRFEANPQVSQESVSLQMAEAMLEYYVANATIAGPFTDQGDWQRVDVEQRFEVPMDDCVLSFQADRIVYNKAEDWLVVVDLKTAARLDQRWERNWETSLQMKLYKASLRKVFQTEGRIDVVIEGLLKHVPSSIRHYVCPDWSQGLLDEAVRNALTIAKLDEDVIQHAQEVNEDLTLGAINLAKAEELAVEFTPVNYGDCYSYNVECPFRRICTADIPERVGILRGEFFEGTGEEY